MKKLIVIALGAVLVALLATGTASASPTMHNCPQDGKWAIAVWAGDMTDAGEALGTCGNIEVAYALTPTGAWQRYIADAPEVNNLEILNQYDGVIALGGPAAPTVPEPVTTSGTLPDGCTINDLEMSVLSVGEGDHLGHTGLHAKPLPVVDGTTATKLQSQIAKAVEFCLYCPEFVQCVPAPDVAGDGHLYTFSVEVIGDQYDIEYPVGHEYIRFDCGRRADGSIFYCRISSSQSIPFNPTCPNGAWAWSDDRGFYCEGYPDAKWGARYCEPGERPEEGEAYCFWN